MRYVRLYVTILVLIGLTGCSRTAAQVTIKPLQHATLSISTPNSAQKILMYDDSPAGSTWFPNNPGDVQREVSVWLQGAQPVSVQTPHSDSFISMSHFGPSQLTFYAGNNQIMQLYPVFYVSETNKSNNVKQYDIHYVSDVVEVKQSGHLGYLESAPLYQWLKTDTWKQEFHH